MIELSDNNHIMSNAADIYVKIQHSAMESMLEKIVTRIERDKICPVCNTECDMDLDGNTLIIYTCPYCYTVRKDLV